MATDDIINFLSTKMTLFQDFAPQKLKELVTKSRIISFETNEAIIEFGESGHFLGILLEGDAEVAVTDDKGDKHRLSILKPGDVFGEMSLMTGDKTIADVIGLKHCKALIIPQHLFSTMIITQPQAIKRLAKIITERLKALSFEEKGDELSVSALKKSDDPYGLKLKSSKPMKLLILNCGISSLQYHLFDTVSATCIANGSIEGIGENKTDHIFNSQKGEKKQKASVKNLNQGLKSMLKMLISPDKGVISSLGDINAIGHRVVHGGDKFHSSVIIDDNVLKSIQELSKFAPLHNPQNAEGIKYAKELFPKIHHVAVFDTTFHHTLPAYAYLYGLPYEYFKEKGIKRYGFHGLSHAYAALKSAEFLKRPYNSLEIAICHLGKGSSICAVDHGRSVDISMGLTPAEGLIMNTRCGNIDPAILINLMREDKLGPDELDELINKKSGLLGLSGISKNIKKIESAANKGNHRALLAIKTYCYQVRKHIGAYMAAMAGLDVLVFTSTIGQMSPGVRSLACQGLSCMGINIDEKKNRQAINKDEIIDIATDDSQIRVLVVPSNEALMIAREMIRTLDLSYVSQIIKTQEPVPIPLEISAHHVHLCPEHVEALFGPGHKLTNQYELSQPGQFACKEKVTLVGPKGRIERVRVLGPTRKATQIEIAMTEQFKLGIQPPIRESGDIENSPGVTLEGSYSTITTDKGVICAMRHIHMSPEQALQSGLLDKDVVRVRVEGDRELIFGDVLIRVNPNYRLAMHIDTDEANAAHITKGVIGYIDGIQSRG